MDVNAGYLVTTMDYIRYDYWLSPTMSKPDIKNVQYLSKFTITKRHSIF